MGVIIIDAGTAMCRTIYLHPCALGASDSAVRPCWSSPSTTNITHEFTGALRTAIEIHHAGQAAENCPTCGPPWL